LNVYQDTTEQRQGVEAALSCITHAQSERVSFQS